jgi:hypothetical protein
MLPNVAQASARQVLGHLQREHAGHRILQEAVYLPQTWLGQISCHAKKTRTCSREAARTLMTSQGGQPKVQTRETTWYVALYVHNHTGVRTRDLDTTWPKP